MSETTEAATQQSRNDTSRRMAGAAAVMMASMFASRVLGFVRDAIISGKFGQGAGSDVYYAAFNVPDLLFYLIAGGALSSAFIPVFTEKITLGRRQEAWRIFSTVACVMSLVVSGVVVAGELLAHQLVRLTSYGFAPELIPETVRLTRIVLPAQLCFFLGGLMMGAQQAHGKFLVPSLGPNIYNVGIIVGGMALGSTLGPEGLCWGALGGAIIGNFVIQLIGVRKLGMRFTPSLAWRDPDVMRVWKLMLPVIFGIALPQVSMLFNKIFASSLGQGPVSALQRGALLMQAPLGIFGQALAIAIFPTMAAQAARKDFGGMRNTVNQGMRFVLFLTIPSSVGLVLLGHPAIALWLQHGVFRQADTDMVVVALTYYSIGLFAWAAQGVLSRGFYALQDTVTPVVVGTVVTLIFIPTNLFFMNGLHLGIVGLPLATTVAATLHMLAMGTVLSRRLSGIGAAGIVRSAALICAASAIAGAAGWAALRLIDLAPAIGNGLAAVKLGALLRLLAGGGVFVGVYCGAAFALRMDETSQIVGMLRRGRSRSGAAPTA